MDATVKNRVQQARLESAVCRGASVRLEDPAIKQQESAFVGMDSQGLTVRPRVTGGNARRDARARMVASVKAKGSALAHLDGRVQSVPSDVQKEGLGQTVLRSVFATTTENVTLKLDSVNVLKVSLVTGVRRSVLQVVTDRTVKACATVLTVRAATTSMEPVCASPASAVHTAGTGCAQTAFMACTVSARVSVRTNTHSAAIQ